VVTLAEMAQSAGLDGVVASPLETAAIRARCGSSFLVVTPGIRGTSAGAEKNDQNRTMGPAEAVAAGASYIVVGRPIIAAADPRQSAEAIAQELCAATSTQPSSSPRP
jgi:orotidine-5'-phosphate decarboxylase